MWRTIAAIVWAIQNVSPTVSTPRATSYAKAIQTQAHKRHIDPFTIVSIIHHESRFRASAISPDGEDYGLGQVRARYLRQCRKDKDPLRKPSPACNAAKNRLLIGAINIRYVAQAIGSWRATCRRLTNRPALFHRWLHGYGGMGNLKRGIICGQKKKRGKWTDLPKRRQVRTIIRLQRRLARTVEGSCAH